MAGTGMIGVLQFPLFFPFSLSLPPRVVHRECSSSHRGEDSEVHHPPNFSSYSFFFFALCPGVMTIFLPSAASAF